MTELIDKTVARLMQQVNVAFENSFNAVKSNREADHRKADAAWDDVRAALRTELAAVQGEPTLKDIDQYRMQMAGISTAAMGYWKKGDSVHPDYQCNALDDVAELYEKYDRLYQTYIAQPRAGIQAKPDPLVAAPSTYLKMQHLYLAASNLMVYLGREGSIQSDGRAADTLMSCLHGLDRGEFDENLFTSYTTPQPAPAVQGEHVQDMRHVGESQFETWYATQPQFASQRNIKQINRDAYAAGMGDTTPQPATSAMHVQPEPSERTAWLIEVPSLQSWFADFPADSGLTKDANQAMHFPTKASAQGALDRFLYPGLRKHSVFSLDQSCYKVTEHIFLDGYAAPVAEGDAKDAQRPLLQEIEMERQRQDGKWGGAAHDDSHDTSEFVQIINDYAGWARQMACMGSYDKARRRLVQVAALAVAACESIDRAAISQKGGQS